MNKEPVIVDERVRAVRNASGHLAYIVLAFGLMIDVVVRGLVGDKAGNWENWDLLGLVFVSSAVGTIYQRTKHGVVVCPRRVWMMMLIVGFVGLVVSSVAVLLQRFWHP